MLAWTQEVPFFQCRSNQSNQSNQFKDFIETMFLHDGDAMINNGVNWRPHCPTHPPATYPKKVGHVGHVGPT